MIRKVMIKAFTCVYDMIVPLDVDAPVRGDGFSFRSSLNLEEMYVLGVD